MYFDQLNVPFLSFSLAQSYTKLVVHCNVVMIVYHVFHNINITQQNIHFKMDDNNIIISKYYCFYCIFHELNAALVSALKKKKIPKRLTSSVIFGCKVLVVCLIWRSILCFLSQVCPCLISGRTKPLARGPWAQTLLLAHDVCERWHQHAEVAWDLPEERTSARSATQHYSPNRTGPPFAG